MQQISNFSTFNDQAEEAVGSYTSIPPNSRIGSTTLHPEGGPGPEGSLMSATFDLAEQPFIALNGGPSFAFAMGISLFVECEAQEEVDHYWEKLSEGGEKGPCGWLTDKCGVSWQVVPRVHGEMLNDRERRIDMRSASPVSAQ